MNSMLSAYSFRMIILYLSAIFGIIGLATLIPILPILGRELEFDKLLIIVPFFNIEFEPKDLAITSLLSISALSGVLAAPVWGQKIDSAGAKPVMILGLYGSIISLILFIGFSHFGLLGSVNGLGLYFTMMATRIFHAVFMFALIPAIFSYAISVSNTVDRTKVILGVSLSLQIGGILGPALAYLVFLHLLIPLYICVFLSFLSGSLVWKFLPVSRFPIQESSSKTLRFYDARYRVYFLIGFVVSILPTCIISTIGFYYQDKFHLSSDSVIQRVSSILILAGFCLMIVQALVTKYWKYHPLLLIHLGGVTATIAFIMMLGDMEISGFQISIVMIIVGSSLCSQGCNICATHTINIHEQGSLAGLFSALVGLGSVFGPLLGGLLYRFGEYYIFQFGSIVMMLLLILVIQLKPVTIR